MKARNSNFELLRLVAMFMIIFIHANMYLPYFCTGGYYTFFNGLVNGICNVGVTLFILISGYFGIQFKIEKLVKMECMMISYSLLETLMLFWMMPEEMRGVVLLEQIIKSCFPFISRKYWFYSCYVCLMLFSGYIQKFIDILEQKKFKHFLLLLIVLFSVLPTLFYFELSPDNGKGLIQMIMIYLLGRYIRLYVNRKLSWKAVVVLGICWLLNGISHEMPLRIGEVYHHLCKDNSVTNLIMAIILFLIFRNIKIESSKINRVSQYVFAVFALNNSMVRCVMKFITYGDLECWNKRVGFAALFGIVSECFIVCLAVGAIRELVLGRMDRKLMRKLNGRGRNDN